MPSAKAAKTPKLPKITTLYEDDNILAIYKPAGIMVHPDGRSEETTLIDWIVKNHPEMKGVGEPVTLSDGTKLERPGIVHRLDRDTTGVLLLAKTREGFTHLKAQFQSREVKKVYRAFVYGDIKELRGVIDLPIGRSKSDFRKWTAQRGKKGEEREAVTIYTTLFRSPEVSYIEARPKTGRTHQIRVHMKAVHHPVVADALYASPAVDITGQVLAALQSRRGAAPAKP